MIKSVCAECKKVVGYKGGSAGGHTTHGVSHTICPECKGRLYPDLLTSEERVEHLRTALERNLPRSDMETIPTSAEIARVNCDYFYRGGV